MLSFCNTKLSVPKKMTRGDGQKERAILKKAIQPKCGPTGMLIPGKKSCILCKLFTFPFYGTERVRKHFRIHYLKCSAKNTFKLNSINVQVTLKFDIFLCQFKFLHVAFP